MAMATKLTKSRMKDEPQSPELSDKVWLARQMEKALAGYPNQQITQETASQLLSLWSELLHRMGREKFEWALRECCLSCDFFPSPSEIARMAHGYEPAIKPYKALAAPENPITPAEWRGLKKAIAKLTEQKKIG